MPMGSLMLVFVVEVILVKWYCKHEKVNIKLRHFFTKKKTTKFISHYYIKRWLIRSDYMPAKTDTLQEKIWLLLWFLLYPYLWTFKLSALIC